MRKIIFLIMDGLGDLPSRILDGKTPLDIAHTPNMDFLAKNGKTGLIYTVEQGIMPESDAALFSLFSYNPFEKYAGRGVIEAYGLGIKIRDGELALRGNLAISDKGIIKDIRVNDISEQDASNLINSLKDIKMKNADFIVIPEEGYRFTLVIKSDRPLSSDITNTHPGYQRFRPGLSMSLAVPIPENSKIMHCKPMTLDKRAKYTADLINEFSIKAKAKLSRHQVNKMRKRKANIILLRDAGNFIREPKSLYEKYKTIWGAVTDRYIEKGICKLVGMDIIAIEPEKSMRKDCIKKAEKVKDVIDFYDCVYVYIKGPDIPGHAGDHKKKKKVIEIIDTYLVKGLINILMRHEQDAILCITSDHSTPCSVKVHTDDPVPVLVYHKGIKPDKVKKFSELACKYGEFGTFNGRQLFPILMKMRKKK